MILFLAFHARIESCGAESIEGIDWRDVSDETKL